MRRPPRHNVDDARGWDPEKVKRVPQQNWEDLANAIIEQAAQDYLYSKGANLREDIERFFRSDWFGVLTRVNPEQLIRALRRKAEERERRLHARDARADMEHASRQAQDYLLHAGRRRAEATGLIPKTEN